MRSDLAVSNVARRDTPAMHAQSPDEAYLLSQRIEVLEQRLLILRRVPRPPRHNGRFKIPTANAVRDRTTAES